MQDKMMRVSGRGNDGTAKPLQINDNGGVKTDDVKRYITANMITIGPEETVVVANLPSENYRFIKFMANVFSSTGVPNVAVNIRCYTGESPDTIIYQKDYVKIMGFNNHTPFKQSFHTVDDEEICGTRVEISIKNFSNINNVIINRKDITLFKSSQSSSKILGLPFNLKLEIGETKQIDYLSENMSVSKVMITADVNNKDSITVAPSPQAPNGIVPLAIAKPLQPGQWTTWEVRNLRYLGARGTSGDILYVEGVL